FIGFGVRILAFFHVSEKALKLFTPIHLGSHKLVQEFFYASRYVSRLVTHLGLLDSLYNIPDSRRGVTWVTWDEIHTIIRIASPRACVGPFRGILHQQFVDILFGHLTINI